MDAGIEVSAERNFAESLHSQHLVTGVWWEICNHQDTTICAPTLFGFMGYAASYIIC
jgi:hypothetical protein